MDGQALDFPSDGFDAAFSIFGVMLFPDWRAGLRELHRVVRPGGRVVLATWGREEGAGPAILFNQAWRDTFLNREPPGFPDGLRTLSRPGGLEAAFRDAGLIGTRVKAVERNWTISSAAWLADNADNMFRQFPAWAALAEDEREQLRSRLRKSNGHLQDEPFSVPSRALIAVGSKP